ncbi:MAG: 2,3-bisphosphoglycerate-independent phosphoglycerate mutase [SAR324 cluster bacterium]|nr:2,3-bisphosphoglycerate-independent phosphoglycerate mutase [SAR324 cluster bacterium]
MNATQLAEQFRGRGPLINIVLDGWGIAEPSEHNAVYLGKTPVMDQLLQKSPNTQLLTHGPHVGLPSDQDMGGSEVGHLTMGAGIIIEQGPTYIKRLIDTGEFNKSEALQELTKNCLDHQTPMHLLGLLSDGNVHSHVDHFIAVIRHAFTAGIKQVYVHALLDGRDTPIQSALDYVDQIEKVFGELKSQRPDIDYSFASGGGREVITMDRDTNWSKIEEGWNVHVRAQSPNHFSSITEAIEHFRNKEDGVVDQNLPSFVIARNGKPIGQIQDNHALVFMNFRADRAIEFTRAVVDDDFPHFDRSPRPNLLFAGMMVYDQDTQTPEKHLVGSSVVENPFGRRMVELGLKQFRLTETQKYAHVTFFYNGGYRDPLDPKIEHYKLIDSDKVASFDLAPAMKAAEIKDQAVKFIASKEYAYGLVNFANADMVGHTGSLEAAITAVEAVDAALGDIVTAIDKVSGMLVITADHGNADQMRNFNKKKQEWERDTKHSLNPVPFIIYDPLYKNDYQLKQPTESEKMNLSQIAATNMILLGRTVPSDINDSLFLL